LFVFVCVFTQKNSSLYNRDELKFAVPPCLWCLHITLCKQP